jgi:hypothetical protein
MMKAVVERIDRAKSKDYVIVDLYKETVGGICHDICLYEARWSLGRAYHCMHDAMRTYQTQICLMVRTPGMLKLRDDY